MRVSAWSGRAVNYWIRYWLSRRQLGYNAAACQACDDSYLGLEITPYIDNDLVFYFGSMTYNPKFGIQDFMSP